MTLARSQEYAGAIVEAVTLGRPVVIHGNVLNRGWIDNLPAGCVEVRCEVDSAGVHPCAFGSPPEQLAAFNRAHMAVHELVAQALLTGDREPARHALMLDPLTSAVCAPAEISAMFDELWAAEAADLPAFS